MICEKSVFPYQNVDNLDYDCFKKLNKMSINRIDVKKYLDLSCVNFDKENTISVVS